MLSSLIANHIRAIYTVDAVRDSFQWFDLQLHTYYILGMIDRAGGMAKI